MLTDQFSPQCRYRSLVLMESAQAQQPWNKTTVISAYIWIQPNFGTSILHGYIQIISQGEKCKNTLVKNLQHLQNIKITVLTSHILIHGLVQLKLEAAIPFTSEQPQLNSVGLSSGQKCIGLWGQYTNYIKKATFFQQGNILPILLKRLFCTFIFEAQIYPIRTKF